MLGYSRQRHLQVTPKWIPHNISSTYIRLWVQKKQDDGVPKSMSLVSVR